jgi:hypothetical protein
MKLLTLTWGRESKRRWLACAHIPGSTWDRKVQELCFSRKDGALSTRRYSQRAKVRLNRFAVGGYTSFPIRVRGLIGLIKIAAIGWVDTTSGFWQARMFSYDLSDGAGGSGIVVPVYSVHNLSTSCRNCANIYDIMIGFGISIHSVRYCTWEQVRP